CADNARDQSPERQVNDPQVSCLTGTSELGCTKRSSTRKGVSQITNFSIPSESSLSVSVVNRLLSPSCSWKLYAERRGEFAGTAKALSTWLDENSEQLRIRKNKDLHKEVPASMGKGKVNKHANGFMNVRFKPEEAYERSEAM
ncbi:MAG TPA: hypothetical protein VFB29_08860, partial [Pseudolabrys sp.]|nr:hypothetical protein [Pseudolabrys sp.]